MLVMVTFVISVVLVIGSSRGRASSTSLISLTTPCLNGDEIVFSSSNVDTMKFLSSYDFPTTNVSRKADHRVSEAVPVLSLTATF